LRRICKEHPTASGALLLSIEPLEREWQLLRERPNQSGGRFDWSANSRYHLLNSSPVSLGWVKGGSGKSGERRRPRATWRHETVKALRALGVTVEDAEGLLDAAGLAEKSQDR
jgi:hypothetical protein